MRGNCSITSREVMALLPLFLPAPCLTSLCVGRVARKIDEIKDFSAMEKTRCAGENRYLFNFLSPLRRFHNEAPSFSSPPLNG